MRRKLYPINVRTRARKAMAAWEEIDPTVIFGNLSKEAFEAEIMQAEEIESKILTAELQLAILRNERDVACFSLWDHVKRVYDGVGVYYGYDSVEYEMVGRTRLSQIKRRRRKTLEE
jgi:hypothetical protein